MEKQIVFFDLDGTLLNDDKCIPESNKRAVRLLQEKGIQTVIATGRTPKQFADIRKELQIDSYVSMNGQYVVYKGKVIHANPIDPQVLHKMSNMSVNMGHALAFCNNETIRISEDHPFIRKSFEPLRMDCPSMDRDFYHKAPVYQGHLYCDSDEAWIYEKAFPEYHFVRWGELAWDILPNGCSKWLGIKKLLQAANVKTVNSFAFGDGLNDLEMLSLVGKGVAMGNALPEVKQAASFVTDSNLDEGILKGLIHYGLIQKKESGLWDAMVYGRIS